MFLALFHIYSCAISSPVNSNSGSTSSFSVVNVEDIDAPIYESGDLKYQPLKSSVYDANRKFEESGTPAEERNSFPLNYFTKDVYDFIAGVDYAVIDLSDKHQKMINEEDEGIIGIYVLLKNYLWKIGFKYVAISEEQVEETFEKAKSHCNMASIDFQWSHVDESSFRSIQLEDVSVTITGCNGLYYKFDTPDMQTPYYTSYNTFSDDYGKVLTTQLTKAFWHNVPRDASKRMTLLGDVFIEERDRNISPSSWTEEDLKFYFDTNRLDSIEGIYEGVFNGKNVKSSKYKFGVVSDGNEYLVHYLDGAINSNDWVEGSLKAVMKKTATPDVYKVEWFMTNKAANDDVYGFIDEYNLLSLRFGSIVDEDNEVKYLKLYPTVSSSKKAPKNPSVGDFLSSGTGFAISNDGFIVTNYHVIESADKIVVQLSKVGNHQEYSAEVVLSDEKNDLAIIKINDNNFDSLGKIPFVFKQNTSQMGTKVYTLGYPLIDSMGESIKLTDGLISSKMGFQGDISSYQISVPVQPGNSGGPLFDYEGNLIGIVNAKHVDTENVSYAIKSSSLKNLIELLPNPPKVNKINKLKDFSLSDQVELIEDFVFLIKTR